MELMRFIVLLLAFLIPVFAFAQDRNFNNSLSGVTTTANNSTTAAWLYGYNGTTWDQLKDDSNKYLYVDIGASNATVAVALNATPSLANGNGMVPTQGGSVLSATNGMYTNVLQGNAALSATNGLYANLLQGNAVLSSSNPIFSQLTTGSAVIGALTANQSVNTAQVNGVTVLTGTGATGTGAQRVTVSEDTNTIAGSAVGTAGTASSNVVTVQGVASMTAVQVSQATASNLNAEVVGAGTSGSPSGGVVSVQGSGTTMTPMLTSSGCSGATLANTKTKPINNAASSSNLLLVSGVASENTHICSINIGPVAAAVNIALVEGTTTTNACDTSTTGMMGGATAATGWQFSANGGLTFGDGVGQLAITATNADNVCLLFSTATQVSGAITYTQY